MLEGLPINQYREIEVTIGPNSTDNRPVDRDGWPELPMPRDSHMLPDHSQQLLRAARSGRLLKPPAPPEDDNEMKDEEEEPKEVQTGFIVKKYVKVARHLETAEPEYLAKRRKGLPSTFVNGQPVQTALRETKVKKLDAEGNIAVYKVLVPEGQAVEGEVQPSDAAIEAVPALAAPGTIVEGVGVVNAEGVVVANDIAHPTPARKRQPPPKRRRAGPGRGRKRVGFAEGRQSLGPSASSTGIELLPDALKREEGSAAPSDGGDTPMGEAGAEDEEGSGEEGSEDEEQDGEHTATPETPSKTSTLLPAAAPTSVPEMELSSMTDITPSETLPDATDPATAVVEPSEPPADNTEPIASPAPATGSSEQPAANEASKSPDVLVTTNSPSVPKSSSDIPTPLEAVDTKAIESVPTDPVLPVLAVQVEATAEPVASIDPTPEPALVVETKAASVPPTDLSPPPVSTPSEPDLLGSLERQLEKDEKDLAETQ